MILRVPQYGTEIPPTAEGVLRGGRGRRIDGENSKLLNLEIALQHSLSIWILNEK